MWDEISQYGDVLLESDSGTGAAKTSYVLGDGELLSQKRGGLGVADYFLKDAQGSVRALTDNTGTLVSGQNYTYTAFGKLLSGQTASNAATNYQYTGQQFDSLSGLYDLRARYYNPGEGRFLGQDTWKVDLRNPFELNRYVYGANNPIKYYDPTGNLLVELKALWNGFTPQQQRVLVVVGAYSAWLLSTLLIWKIKDYIRS